MAPGHCRSVFIRMHQFHNFSGTFGTIIWRVFHAGRSGHVAKVKETTSIMIVMQIAMWEVLSLYGELCAPFCTLIWDMATRTWIK